MGLFGDFFGLMGGGGGGGGGGLFSGLDDMFGGGFGDKGSDLYGEGKGMMAIPEQSGSGSIPLSTPVGDRTASVMGIQPMQTPAAPQTPPIASLPGQSPARMSSYSGPNAFAPMSAAPADIQARAGFAGAQPQAKPLMGGLAPGAAPVASPATPQTPPMGIATPGQSPVGTSTPRMGSVPQYGAQPTTTAPSLGGTAVKTLNGVPQYAPPMSMDSGSNEGGGLLSKLGNALVSPAKADAVPTGADPNAFVNAGAKPDVPSLGGTGLLNKANSFLSAAQGKSAASTQETMNSFQKSTPTNPTSPYAMASSFLGKNEMKGREELSGFFNKSMGQNVDPSKTPWCAAFVNSALGASGQKGTGSLMAKSFLNYGTATDKPTQGDIVVLNRGNDPSLGHVGFYSGTETRGGQDYIKILGGNQDNGVSVKSYPASQLAGYRHPPSAEEIQQKQLPSAGGMDLTPSSAVMASLPADKNERLQSVYTASQGIYGNTPQAKIAAAQAILESGLSGKPSKLATEDNNLFGIKGKGTAGSVNYGTTEHTKTGSYDTRAGFAKNATLNDSFKQHQSLMNRLPRYKGVLDAGTVEDAAKALTASGYAGDDAKYGDKVLQVYNDYVKPLEGI